VWLAGFVSEPNTSLRQPSRRTTGGRTGNLSAIWGVYGLLSDIFVID
jgi:hypothetical protein